MHASATSLPLTQNDVNIVRSHGRTDYHAPQGNIAGALSMDTENAGDEIDDNYEYREGTRNLNQVAIGNPWNPNYSFVKNIF